MQIEDVWSHVRVFGGVAKWLPTIGAAELKSELLVIDVLLLGFSAY